MSRIRSFKPEMVDDEELGACSVGAQLLFDRLIIAADDYGNGPALPALLASKLFPYRDDVTAPIVGGWLDELEGRHLVRRYRVRRQAFVALPGWSQNQRVDHPGKPLFPGPDEADDTPKPSGESRESTREGVATSSRGFDLAEPLSRDSRPSHARFSPESSRVELTPSPNGSGAAPTRAHEAALIDLDAAVAAARPVHVDLVAVYGDACREAGSEPVDRMPARVGSAVSSLRAAGKTDEVLTIAVRELARRNEQPARLAWIVGDVERIQAGTPIGRVIAPAIRAASENPLDVRARAQRALLAEQRAEEARNADRS